MPLVHNMWTRLKILRLPALALACSFVWMASPFAQLTGPTSKLFQGVEVNDMNAVKAAIGSGANLGAKNAAGKTAADVAVDKGHFIIAHYLLSQRNAKTTASQQKGKTAIVPSDRLRKPAAKSARKLIGKKTGEGAAAKQAPRKLKPARPDSTTRVTEILAPAPIKSKPRTNANQRKTAKYGFPPRKPRSPAQLPVPMTKEIVVASSPGVQVPNGNEPEGQASETLPMAIANDDQTEDKVTGDVAPSEQQEVSPADDAKKAETSLNPVAAVGNFFKSIVDLVNPLADTAPVEPEKEMANPEENSRLAAKNNGSARLNNRNASPPEPASDSSLEEDLMAAEEIEAIDDGTESQQQPNSNEDDELSDALETLEVDESQELESLDEEPLESLDEEPLDQVAEAPKASASARTLDRIKSLLGDDPKEDEFGLPVVDIPTTEHSDKVDAADDVLDSLVEADDPLSGFLDDKPGPETGPGRQPIEANQAPAPVSDALRARLRRLGDAVTREITVDTNEILRQGRNRASDPLFQPSEKRAKTPRQAKPRRIDQVTEKVERNESRITKRRSPSNRFKERLEQIKRSEQSVERAVGDRDSWEPETSPAVKPTDLETHTRSDNMDDAENEGPAVLDRIVGFFGGSQTQPSAPKPEQPDPQSPDYRGAPSTRKLPEEAPVPEIENLEAFDQEDETKPDQAPGTLEPVFLDRLAGLFNEEEANQAEGWKAEVKADNPFPGRGDLASQTGGSSWTTTVEMNAGEGKDPVIIQVAQSPDEGLEALEPEDDPFNQAEGTQRPVRPSGGKRTAMATEPYGDPLRAPNQQRTATQQKTFFGRLTKLFQPKDPVELKRESLLLEPDEKLSTAHDAQDGGVKVASRTEGDPKNYWPITKLTKSDPQVSPPRRPGALTRTSLSDVTLTLGESVNLENLFPPGKNGIDPNNECVKKNRGTTLFCIEPIDWPTDLQQTFVITTILYTGSMAIVRYDQTVPTRLHTLFGSDDFDKVTAYYQMRFGEPTEILKRSIAPLAKPRQDNPTVSWRSKDQKTNAITVLEIRKFDDTRGGFPDTGRGAVMLYYTSSPSIFPQVSSHELMRLKRIGDITESEAEKTANEAANDPPAGGPAVSEDELFGSEPVLEDDPGTATDAALDALPDSEPDPADQGGLFERPEDILNEPDLTEPELTEPDLLDPQLTEPDLFEPENQDEDNNFSDVLNEEPITDESPDEIIEILPSTPRNPS